MAQHINACTISAALVAAMALISPAQAAPITYSEAISGDLGAGSTQNFRLEIGMNTISGITGYGPDNVWDMDGFSFVVPAGAILERIDLSMTLASGSSIGSGWGVQQGSNVDSFREAISARAPGTGSLVHAFSGAYAVTAGYIVGTPNSTAAYTFTMNVSAPTSVPVPEPGALALFGIGLLAVSRTRRFTKKKSAVISEA